MRYIHEEMPMLIVIPILLNSVSHRPSDFLSYGSLLTPEKHQGIAKRLLSLHDSKLLNPLPLHLSSTPVILSLHYAVANITEKVYTYLEKIVAVEHVYIEEKSLWEKMGVGMRDDVNGIIVKWKKLAIELDCLGNIVASFLTERHSVSSNRSRASLLAAVLYLKESWEGCVENDGFMFGENEKLEANETMFWEVTQALLDTKLWVERATGEKDWDVKLVAGNKIIQFAEKKKDYLNGL